MKYTIIDHTADFAVEFYGKTIPELFENSAISLSEIIFEKPVINHQIGALDLTFSTDSIEINYIDFLREILYHINQNYFYFYECHAQLISETALTINCSYIQMTKNDIIHEIKAVTYHECGIKDKIKNKQKIYYAKVTFDI